MEGYTCPRCNYNTVYKNDFRRHLSIKKLCELKNIFPLLGSCKPRRRSKKVSFVTADGKRVSFTPKKKRSSSKTPPHLKKYTNRMKELGEMYRDGEFGNMTWKQVVKKYMSKSSSRRRRFSKRRSSRRRKFSKRR